MAGDREQGILDRFSSVDELLAGPVLDTLKQINNRLAAISNSDGQGRQINLEDRPRIKRAHDLSAQVAPFEQDPADDQIAHDASRTTEAPFDGWVNGIILGWPDGAEQNAGIGLYHADRGTKYFPHNDDDFAAFNDYNDGFSVSFPVEKGEPLEIRYLNTNTTAMPLNALIQFEKKFPDEELDTSGR